jgi:phospholipid/cholesterol/gamma-HCH transport system permease protein
MPQTFAPPPELRIDADTARAVIAGPWTLANLGPLFARRPVLPAGSRRWTIDATRLMALDTAGAMLLLRVLRGAGLSLADVDFTGLREADLRLVELVDARSREGCESAEPYFGFRAMLERMGHAVARFGIQGWMLLGFVGLTLATFAAALTGRAKLRWTSIVHHMEETGLDAVPIVALLSFLVGAVIAFLGATVLRDFGASIFTIELVSYAFLREFGVLLTAIILAGRSGSAFTAQIGSMKSREELDAIKALGLDPVELLVLPRLLALLAMLPLLTFLSMIMGLFGGGIVSLLALDISAGQFITRLQEMTEIRHFWAGMIKAPVFAFLIAVVGCLEGLKVEGSAESVGRHTTASVVQAIFLVIVFDALFAVFFMEVGL